MTSLFVTSFLTKERDGGVASPHAGDKVLLAGLNLGGEQAVDELEGAFQVLRRLLPSEAPPVGGCVCVDVHAFAHQDVHNDLRAACQSAKLLNA